MQGRRTTIGIGFAVCLLAVGVLLVSTLTGRSADDDKGLLSSFLSRALSTPQSRVSIGLVRGALLSDSTISDIKISDRNGVWLEIDKVHLNWTRSALLFRKLQIDKLEIGTVRYLRRALPNEQPEAVSDEPLLPELPLKVEIKDFSLKELALGAPVIGTAASVSATGAATLGNPAEGLNLRFDARRLDAAGTLAARVELVPDSQRLALKLSVDEPANGIAANALNIPGRPPVKLTLDGNGTLDSFDAQLAFAAGDDIGANGSAQIRRVDKERRLTVDMASRIEGLLPAVAAFFLANRLLPIGIADRADKEVWAFFATWALAILIGLACRPRPGWIGVFVLSSVAWAAIPLVSWWAVGMPREAIGCCVDLLSIAFALAGWAALWRLRRKGFDRAGAPA